MSFEQKGEWGSLERAFPLSLVGCADQVGKVASAMFALLLAAVSPYALTLVPKAQLTFPGSPPQIISGPANTDQAVVDQPWTLDQILYAPSKNAAAVRFCWDIGKFGSCETSLARPGQPVLKLSGGDVSRLLWATDGKYLIGAGANTLRLWNLVGGVRTAVTPVAGSTVQRLWLAQPNLGKSDLCVSVRRMFPVNGVYRTTMTSIRYALPALKVLTVTTQKGKEAECRPLSPNLF
ncbi:hypothetical protein [Deinococcus aquatilis]|uniref:hypothetical protein n=1 Tax=Deinococcus aquatilis TaxID=519440 RepID=UPI001B7F8AD7|nr:hypothetical protein [Deinococcus aquatilis]